MKTMAIICEYNPFHNGHAHQIIQHRTEYGVECVIAVMSGNFVQRGAPAVCDKWTRAKMALLGGCDLVLELPTVFATQSAERFAWGAIQLIESLGKVHYLSFGSECGDIQLLSRAAKQLITPDFQEQVTKILKSGISYPAAREAVFQQRLGTEIADSLSQPNNLLAIEYMKNLLLLNSRIVPITLKRTVGHHQAEAEKNFCSASYLRELIAHEQDLSPYIPSQSFHILTDAIHNKKAPVTSPRLDTLITYLLRTKSPEALRQLPDMSEGLESRFITAAKTAHTFADIAEAVKTKRYTRTRIDRTLVHLLLGITKQDTTHAPCYFRVLGANSVGTAFLRSIKDIPYPVITKTANTKFSNREAERMFAIDCRATDVYALLYPNQEHNCAGLDFTTSPILQK